MKRKMILLVWLLVLAAGCSEREERIVIWQGCISNLEYKSPSYLASAVLIVKTSDGTIKLFGYDARGILESGIREGSCGRLIRIEKSQNLMYMRFVEYKWVETEK